MTGLATFPGERLGWWKFANVPAVACAVCGMQDLVDVRSEELDSHGHWYYGRATETGAYTSTMDGSP